MLFEFLVARAVVQFRAYAGKLPAYTNTQGASVFKLDEIRGLADVPRLQARVRGTGIAQIFEARQTSFDDFDRHTSQVAQGLTAAGLAPQSRIGFLGKNSDHYFELLFGAAKAQAVLVGVNWRLAPPEIEYVLKDAGCSMVFVSAEFYDVVEAIVTRDSSVTAVVAMDRGHQHWPAFDTWRDSQAAIDPLLPMRDGDDVLQLYTSGTTGHPKGVQLTNANYCALWRASEDARWGLFDAGLVTLTCMPVFHVAGANMGIFALAQGSTNLVLKDVDALKILEVIPQYQVSYALFVPALILMLTQMPQSQTTNFTSLKKLFYGASPINEDLLKSAQKLFACEFFGLYGLTETTGGGTCLLPEGHAAGKLRSCGTAYPGVEIKIVDGEGQAVPPGEVGEIVLRHGIVMKGYWNKPEATADAIRDGWFQTGDAGYLDVEGYLYIHDRMKDMVVSGGENVYPAEVENALFGHPAVADVAVIGVPDERWGEAVKAVVVVKPGSTVTVEELVSFARERIAAYKVPKSVDFVSALPRNPSGKILRRELRAPYWQGRARQVN